MIQKREHTWQFKGDTLGCISTRGYVMPLVSLLTVAVLAACGPEVEAEIARQNAMVAQCRAAKTNGEAFGTPSNRGPCWGRLITISKGYGISVYHMYTVTGGQAVLTYDGETLVAILSTAPDSSTHRQRANSEVRDGISGILRHDSGVDRREARMKRLTDRFRAWLRHRQRREERVATRRPLRLLRAESSPRVRRELVTVFSGGEISRAICIGPVVRPPKRLCLDENRDETLVFLNDWRSRFEALSPDYKGQPEWLEPPRRPRALPRIHGYVDFSQLEYVSTSVALILTADYDRIATFAGSPPPAINLHSWNDRVFRSLFEIGFFEGVGIVDQMSDKLDRRGHVTTMRIMSGRNARDLESVGECIRQLAADLVGGNRLPELELMMNNALGEAMTNVSRHAYPADHIFAQRHVGKWWVTASVDDVEGVFTIAIYDQGASIPVTYPRKRLPEAAKDMLSSLWTAGFAFGSDGAYIRAAMELGSSSTDLSYRGKGLPELKDVIDVAGAGHLAIYSRGGYCKYDAVEGMKHDSYPVSVGGTLIEWTLRLG